MKTMIKMLFFTIIATCVMTNNVQANNMVADNRTAYEIAALAAYDYLNYRYERGADSSRCSHNGTKLCTVLRNLAERARLFNNPPRDDLKMLARDASNAFRDFDLSGNANNRKIFVNSLKNLLQATLPLLSEKEAAECRMLIQRISSTI